MDTELASAFMHVEGIPKVFHTSHIRHDGLFLVHLQMEFLLDKLGYRLAHSLCCPLGLAEGRGHETTECLGEGTSAHRRNSGQTGVGDV